MIFEAGQREEVGKENRGEERKTKQERGKVSRVRERSEGKGRDGEGWRAGDMELCGMAMSRGGCA